MAPLTRARDAAAHGDSTAPALIDARARRSQLVNLARLIVARAFVNDSTLPLQARDVRK